MVRGLLFAGLLWAGGAAAAPAQEGAPLPAADVRAALFGYELSGEILGAEGRWTECIDRAGRTVWRMEDFVTHGRLVVRDDGQACFRYSHTEYRREVCWTMRREGERLRFDLVNGESLPLVATARRPVSSCQGEAPIA